MVQKCLGLVERPQRLTPRPSCRHENTLDMRALLHRHKERAPDCGSTCDRVEGTLRKVGRGPNIQSIGADLSSSL